MNNYIKGILENLKSFSPVFTVVGILAGLFACFTFFPDNELPQILQHNLLLTYLYLLLFFLLFLLFVIILLPLNISSRLQSKFQTLSVKSENLKIIHTPFLYAALLLIAIGILMIYSSSFTYSELKYENPNFFLKNHFYQLIIAIVISFLLISVKYKIFTGTVFKAILIIILNVIVVYTISINRIIDNIGLINISSNSNLYFELSKLIVIFYLAFVLNKKNKFNLVLYIPLITFIAILLYFEKSESIYTLIMIIAITTILSIGRFNIKFATSILLLIEVIFVMSIIIPLIIKGSQLGGFFGVGLGNSVLKSELGYEAFTSSIFMIILEETGILGAGIILLLYVVYSSTVISFIRKMDSYNQLLVLGCISTIGIQLILSIIASFANIPIHSINLPFLSYGFLRFELLINIFLTGIVLVEIKRILFNTK